MGIIETIITLLSSSGVGAILGTINGWIQRREERENLKLRYDHEENLENLRIQDRKLAHEQQQEAAVVNNAHEIEVEEVKAFNGSLQTSEKGQTVKAMVRPLVLLYLLTMTTAIVIGLVRLMGDLDALAGENMDEIMDLVKACVYMVLSLTSMAVSWYFAQRPSKHFDQMLNAAYVRHNTR